MDKLLRGRAPYILIFLACAGLLAFALYAEHVMGLEPCPLCMLQRFGFLIMGLVALVAAIHGPRSWGRWVYAVPYVAGGGWGLATAGRHVWLQSLPEDQVPDCGPGLFFMREFEFGWGEIVREAFTGAGECAEVSWTFLGLTIPMWTLLWYVGLIVFMLLASRIR